LSDVYIRDGESQEGLLKRFQRSVQMSGILREVKASRYFMSKGEAARLKAKKAARRYRRKNRA
jgi:ribosomal protein S21